MTKNSTDTNVSTKLLPIFAGIFSAILVLIPSMSSKFIAIGSITIVGSTLIFPITLIFNDVLTEVYGYKQSRIIIWTGMGMQIFAAFFYWLIEVWPAASFWHNQEAYSTILGSTPRIVLASLTAYFFGEFANSYILSRLKHKQNGLRGTAQAIRYIVSTIVAEGLDSLLFMTIAFAGTMASAQILTIILTIWGIKVAYEIIALPASIKVANWVKKLEGIDVIDTPQTTTYNPFKLGQLDD